MSAERQHAASSLVPDEKRQAAIDAAVERLTVMNDQLAVFWAVRRVLDDGAAYAEMELDQIRELYRDFDAKHPAKGEQP